MANVSRNSAEEPTQISYQRLDAVLGALGFVRKETEELIVYRETDHGAFIALPAMSADSLVGDPHLITVRNTAVGKGVTSQEKFEALLYDRMTEVPPASRRPRSLVRPIKPATERPRVKKRTASASA